MLNKIVLILFCIFLFSCNKKVEKLDPQAYIDYMENRDNAFQKTIEVGDCIYKFQWKTPEYIACKEFGSQKQELKTRVDQLGNTIWLNIYMSPNKGEVNLLKRGAKGLDEYNERLDYFLRYAMEYMKLKQGGKEMKRVAYHFENNYGVTPHDVMIVGFELTDNQIEDIEFVYEDVIFDNGPLKVTLSKKQISVKPQLIL